MLKIAKVKSREFINLVNRHIVPIFSFSNILWVLYVWGLYAVLTFAISNGTASDTFMKYLGCPIILILVLIYSDKIVNIIFIPPDSKSNNNLPNEK